MSLLSIKSYLAGRWIEPGAEAALIKDPVRGEPLARVGKAELDMAAALRFARDQGGPALREMTFHDRARKLKALALYLKDKKAPLYALSSLSGATRKDSAIDIDGGITTMLVFASKGRRELPDAKVYLDGKVEQISRHGTFKAQHICTPRHGVAVHINAFNFPVWGMLEKLAPALLAGVPAIIKPASVTSYLSEACFQLMLESGLFPEGSFQLISGSAGDLLSHLNGQDLVSFTGSAKTARQLRQTPALLDHSVPFIAEQDSLNASILGPDADPDQPEFDLFMKEIVREMTVKAGQKCTAIRRILVPKARQNQVVEALSARLEAIVIGDPTNETVDMGALVSQAQKADVEEKAALIGAEARQLFGAGAPDLVEADPEKGAFLKPRLYLCEAPLAARAVHEIEAFGPVATVMPFESLGEAIQLTNLGGGSLVTSLMTHDPEVATEVALGVAPYHGRLYINDRSSMAESTGHGSPLPHLVHGGPGRAGGGEEMGGARGVMHYLQRTAVQGSPTMLAAVGGTWLPGAPKRQPPAHPFRLSFDALSLGQSITTKSREITFEDIETFAHFTGDTFYAHMDEDAARANPFFPGRVAHGYLLLSFAAGLFVDPAPGPVLANTGLNGLQFEQPLVPGDRLKAELTVLRKTRRNDEYGEIAWHVRLSNQEDEQVASYELLTMVAYGEANETSERS